MKLLMVNFTEGDLSDSQWAQLRAVAPDPTLLSLDDPHFDDALADAEGIVLRLGMAFGPDSLEKAPSLRYIGMYGTGYGRIDVAAASARGVVVTNVRDYATQSVAEPVIAASIEALRDLPHQLADADALGYAEPEIDGRTLASQTVGIIGLGAIGGRTARLIDAIGADVSYYSSSRHADAEEAGIAYKELPDLVGNSSLVSIHVPAAPDTTPLLTAELIDRLPSGAVLVNTAPNETVDLDAVERRLKAGTLMYVFDHTDEMPAELARRLGAYAGCYAYPPLGYVTEEANNAKQQVLVDNITGFAEGSPQNVVS